MYKYIVAALFALQSICLSGQNRIWIGIETGILRSNYLFSSNATPNRIATITDGHFVLRFGINFNHLTFETGISGISNRTPYFIPNSSGTPSVNHGADRFFHIDLRHFPLNAGFRFEIIKNMEIVPKIGIGLLTSLNGSRNISFWADGPITIEQIVSGNITQDPGVTVAIGHRPSSTFFTFQAAIETNYTVSNFIQIAAGANSTMPAKSIYYENITQYTTSQPLEGTALQNGPLLIFYGSIRVFIPSFKDAQADSG